MSTRRRLFPALLATIVLAGGCGSGGTTTNATGTIALSLSPTSASVQQGASTQVTGTLTRTDFTGDVTVLVTGVVPPGVTGTATLQPINGGNTAQVTLQVALSTTPGTYPLTVTASGSGVSSVSATFTLTVTAAPSNFQFTISPTNTTIAQGASTQIAGTVIRNNFTGDIAITVTGAPTGVTSNVTISPVNGANAASVTISAASTTAPGTYTLNVVATGSVGVVSASLSLTIAVAGSFTLSPSTATISLAQGVSNTLPVTAVRSGGFSGTLVYSVTGSPSGALPPGITAAVTPTGTADQSTLTISVAASVAVGTYTIVAHATAFGTIDQTEVVTVSVVPPAVSVHLDYSACAATAQPIWVAVQDGTGAFFRVAGTGNTYTLSISSSKGALATVTQNGTQFTTSVFYFSQAEMAAYTGVCTAAVTTKTISGSVTGISGTMNPEISLGGANAFVNVASPNFVLNGVAPGVQDLVAYDRANTSLLTSNDVMIFRRNQNLATGSTITPVLNFQTEGVQVATATANITGGAVNSYFYTMNYLSGASCTSNQINFTTGTESSPITMFGAPASAQLPSDFHNLFIQQINGQADTRSVSTSFNLLANKTIAIGAGVGTVNTTVLPGSYERLQAQFTLASDYNNASLSYSMNGGSLNRFFINQTTGYLGGATAITLTPPDLTTVSGFLATWGPSTTGSLQWTATASSTVPPTMCAEGATFRTASSGVGGA